MFERYTEKARRVIFFARYEASQFGSTYIETEHLLLGIVREDKALTNRFLRSQVESIRKHIESHTVVREKTSTSVDLPVSNESKRALAYAAEEAERLADKHIGTEHLLLGLLREEKCLAAQILTERDVRLDHVREELGRQPHQAAQALSRPSQFDALNPYITDVVEQTRPLVGRESELDRLIELLCRFSRTNAVLVGETGVGKRTIVGALARRIADGNVPQALAGKSVLVLDLPQFRVLQKDGSWCERIDRALVASAENGAIFFVDRMHDRPGGSSVAPLHVTDLLRRPIIARKIQCVGTSTAANFAKLQEERHWLAEDFKPIEVAPASEDAAINVLQQIKTVYEKFHHVSFKEEAIERAVLWASKYCKNGCLPGIAVDVIDEAGAAAQLRQPAFPPDVIEVHKRINFIVHRLEAAIANHEFEKARFYSNEERKERANLAELHKKYNFVEHPAFTISLEDIQRAVSKLTNTPIDAIL